MTQKDNARAALVACFLGAASRLEACIIRRRAILDTIAWDMTA